MLPIKFQLIWPNGLILEKIFFLIGHSGTKTAYGGHISSLLGMNYEHFVQDLPYIIPTK